MLVDIHLKGAWLEFQPRCCHDWDPELLQVQLCPSSGILVKQHHCIYYQADELLKKVVFSVMTLCHLKVVTNAMKECAPPIFKAENYGSRVLPNIINHLQDYNVNFHWHVNQVCQSQWNNFCLPHHRQTHSEIHITSYRMHTISSLQRSMKLPDC
jgi:hypothetical protein